MPGTVFFDQVMRYCLFYLKKVAIFVLDEADIMISQQRHQDQNIMIKKSLKDDCKFLFFSAAYDTYDTLLETSGTSLLKHYVIQKR